MPLVSNKKCISNDIITKENNIITENLKDVFYSKNEVNDIFNFEDELEINNKSEGNNSLDNDILWWEALFKLSSNSTAKNNRKTRLWACIPE